jgi:hypothetical protein
VTEGRNAKAWMNRQSAVKKSKKEEV